MKGHHGFIRSRLTYANVVATLALLLAISGGTAYAASKLIKGSQIAKGTITAKNIKSGSLLSKDFKKGQIPAGARGATGPQGAQGGQGAAGSAIGYAAVSPGSSGAPTFTVNTGFQRVTEPQPANNIYCLTPPAGVGNSIPLELTSFGGTNSVVQSVNNQQCAAGDYELQGSGTFGTGQGFTVVIP